MHVLLFWRETLHDFLVKSHEPGALALQRFSLLLRSDQNVLSEQWREQAAQGIWALRGPRARGLKSGIARRCGRFPFSHEH